MDCVFTNLCLSLTINFTYINFNIQYNNVPLTEKKIGLLSLFILERLFRLLLYIYIFSFSYSCLLPVFYFILLLIDISSIPILLQQLSSSTSLR